MKKTIIIFLLLSIYSLAQENRLIRQNDLTDSLNAIRTLIGTGGIALPDSVLFSSDSTNQRTFSDAKYQTKAFLNVKDYGAVGDTLTDDVTAIQSAIDYLEDKGGGTLFFPDGVYMISNPLGLTGDNIVIKGSGNTSIKYTDDALTNGEPSPMLVVGINWDLQTGDETRVHNFSMQDITWDFNGANNNTTALNYGSGILIQYADYIYLNNVTVNNALYIATEIFDSRFINITNCKASNFRERTLGAGAAALSIVDRPTLNITGTDYGGYSIISNNIFYDGDFCGIQVMTNGKSIISNNQIANVPYGIYTESGTYPANDITITGNMVDSCSGGILVGNTSATAGTYSPNENRIIISDNTITGNGVINDRGIVSASYNSKVNNNIVSNVAYGITMLEDWDAPLTGNIEISNNFVTLYHGANGMGIGVAKTDPYGDNICDYTMRNVQILNNTVNADSNLRSGIEIYGNIKDVTISGNTVYNSGKSGIGISTESLTQIPSNIRIEGNDVFNNNQSESATSLYNAGIGIDYNIDSVFIIGNRIYDNQPSKTQGYGITIVDSNEVVILKDNILLTNATAPILIGSNAVVTKLNNIVSENNGEGIFSSNVQKTSTYQINNPSLTDSIFIGYFDTDITIDSIWFSTDDSISVQIRYGTDGYGNELIFGNDTPVIGDEIAPDSGFNVITGYWNLYQATASGGKVHFDGDVEEYVYSCSRLTIGTKYIIEYIISDYTSGEIYPSLGTSRGTFRTSTGTFKDTLTAAGNDCINIFGYLATGSIDSVSVREISASQVISGDSYFSSFNTNTIPADSKAYLYFTNIDTNVTNFKFKIYWRGDDVSVVNNVNGFGNIISVSDTTAFRTFSDLKYSTSDVDSSVINDLIDTKLDTMASDTSTHTMAEIDKAVDNTLYSIVKVNPDSATTFTLLRTKAEIVIDSVFALVQGTSALVDFNLAYGTDRTSGTNVFASSQSADNVTVGETFTTFSSATIPVNNMLWLNITNTDNTPEEFLCVIYYH